MMPHFGLVRVASPGGWSREFIFCDYCLRQERNEDTTESYCSLHRPGRDQTQATPSLREDHVENAIQTILLAACEASESDSHAENGELLVLSADSPPSQPSSSSAEKKHQTDRPTESRSSSPPTDDTPGQTEPSRQSSSQTIPSTAQTKQPGRRGPGRRADNLRINLPNPPPLPEPGQRPSREVLARHGVIVPHIPLVPALRPSKQPSATATDLAWYKAHRLCTNCHKEVDDLHFSKCSACRAAGLERARRYQAKKREEKAMQMKMAKESQGRDGTQSSERQSEQSNPRTLCLPRLTTTPQPIHLMPDASARDRIYMTFIDTLPIHPRRRSTGSGQRAVLGPSREQDLYLHALDRLTDIRLSTTSSSPSSLPEAAPGPHHTSPPPRERPRGYSPPDPQTPRNEFNSAWRMSSGSLPTPAPSSSPFGPQSSSNAAEQQSSPFRRRGEEGEYQLHPLLANIPPEQWSSLPSSWRPESEMPVRGGYPSNAGNWGVGVDHGCYNRQQRGLLGDVLQDCPYRYHHPSTAVAGSGERQYDEGSGGWVDGPGAKRLDMNVVDPALVSVQEGMMMGGLEEVDIEESVKFSGAEEGVVERVVGGSLGRVKIERVGGLFEFEKEGCIPT